MKKSPSIPLETVPMIVLRQWTTLTGHLTLTDGDDDHTLIYHGSRTQIDWVDVSRALMTYHRNKPPVDWEDVSHAVMI
uniref:DUF551 domain-containing protein n=1 Tax=Angiostrongylus cantonensis TaxID=6313 RepID=A0A0K0DBV5_ANGCA